MNETWKFLILHSIEAPFFKIKSKLAVLSFRGQLLVSCYQRDWSFNQRIQLLSMTKPLELASEILYAEVLEKISNSRGRY